jgi:iron complex transport system ATP-binding protein
MISIRALAAGYRDSRVLDGLSLDVADGEVVAICGPNGCGKTTLVRVLSGALKPSGGQVAVDGSPLNALSGQALARTVAVVGQGAPLPVGFTVFETVMMGRTPHLRLLQSEGRSDVEAARRAMARTNCWQLRDRNMEALSGGERQRVLIARALAQEPRVLLLDEPTSHLDLQHQVDAFRLVQALCREHGVAAIAVVHDLTLAGAFADRIALMSNGTIVEVDRPGDVLREDAIERVFGVAVRVIQHPVTGRPVVVPEVPATELPLVAEVAS